MSNFSRAGILAVCLSVVPSFGLHTNYPPSHKAWLGLKGRSVMLVHTGSAALDDGLETGFRTHWKFGPWHWIADTTSAGADSGLIFGMSKFGRYYAGGRHDRKCETPGHERRGNLCFEPDLYRTFELKSQGRVLLSQPTRLHKLEHGDAMAVDVVADFQSVLQMMVDESMGKLSGMEESPWWPDIALTMARRDKLKGRTVLVPRGWVQDSLPAQMERDLGMPVRQVPMDSLDRWLGSDRDEVYLEPIAGGNGGRGTRLRSVRDGQVLAAYEELQSVQRPYLLPEDLRRLGDIARGLERREAWALDGGLTASLHWTEYSVQISKEVWRGYHALLGFSSRSINGEAEDDGASHYLDAFPVLHLGVRTSAVPQRGDGLFASHWGLTMEWQQPLGGFAYSKTITDGPWRSDDPDLRRSVASNFTAQVDGYLFGFAKFYFGVIWTPLAAPSKFSALAGVGVHLWWNAPRAWMPGSVNP